MRLKEKVERKLINIIIINITGPTTRVRNQNNKGLA